MHIWEVEVHFKCPVVGTMLSVEKHKDILKKCGYDVKRLKPYEYHHQIMAKLVDKNNVSVKVDNYIRNQARREMIQIADLSEDKIRELWELHSGKGNVGPMMYAIIAKENASVDLLQEVYGQVHMMAHANMTEIFHVRQKLVLADEHLTRVEKKLVEKHETIKAQLETRKSDLKKLSLGLAENQHLATKLLELEARVSPENEKDNPTHWLQEKIADLEHHLEKAQSKLRLQEREKRTLEIDLFSARNETQLIKEEIASLVATFRPCAPPECPIQNDSIQEPCPRYKLCVKRVFMIGGITKMKSFYKEIVEKAGGEFDYHDGYMKNARTNLEAMVKRCDLVLCPVSCNSHNACLKVKKLCNRYNKELKILSSPSLSAVTQALFIQEKETV